MTEEEPFLRRWSRRKLEAKDAPEQRNAEQEADARPAPSGAVEVEPGQAPRQLTEADFADVDFEALDAKSDYTRFLAPGVPEAIKQKALRRLWASDAVFSQVDPFQEYAGDFTDAAVAVPAGTLKTAYRIGKGYLTDQEVAEWEKLGQPPEEARAADDPAPPQGAAVASAAAEPATASEPSISFGPEPAEQPDVHALLRQSDAYFAELYPVASNHLIDSAALSAPNVRFLVARRGGAAVGCGALVLGADGEAELKRMFVAAEARGRRIGSQILDALEAAGKAEGVRVIRLETGIRQPESLALYRRHGYTERGPFGAYTRDPLSRCFEKWLA
jgi:putative acetyltransferase